MGTRETKCIGALDTCEIDLSYVIMICTRDPMSAGILLVAIYFKSCKTSNFGIDKRRALNETRVR